MRWRNNDKVYGSVSRIFHWLIAVLVIFMIMLGLLMDTIPAPYHRSAIDFHRSTGLLILVLTVLRLGWRLYNPAPVLPALIKPEERILSRLAHTGFYSILVVMPLIGWAMSSAFERPVQFYYLFTLPPLIAANDEAGRILANLHALLGYFLAFLIVLHILAVPYYRRTRKLNLMYRIWPVLKK